MKPFEKLSRLGRLRRMRELAHSALEKYGLGSAQYTLVRYSGNTLYRVYSSENIAKADRKNLFIPSQFLLRVHWAGYRNAAAIQLELEWLRSLREDCGLPVPEPVPTLKGNLLVELSHPGIPESRYCSLLRWVNGRRLGERAKSSHYTAQGRLMAKMHSHAMEWRPSEGACPRVYDWNGLFKEIPALCLPTDDIWSLLPESCVASFKTVAQRSQEAMERLGKSPETFGLIHADLGVDANLLFWYGQPRAIDFDEIGLGYWIYDLAVALEHCRKQQNYRFYRDALLDGYSEIRSLSCKQIQYLDLFMATFDVYLGLWANAVSVLHPEQKAIRQRFKSCVRLIDHYLDSGSQNSLFLSK